MSELQFKAWPKIPRWEASRWTITEKIDGTNVAVVIDEYGNIGAQSRNRLITPGKSTDNYGFAQWVQDNKEELLVLGPGHFYGEWWGSGIARRYNQTEKIFSLFEYWRLDDNLPKCCRVVPTLGHSIPDAIDEMLYQGSRAAPGFMKPEGLMLLNTDYRQQKVYYKIILDK